MKIRCFSCCLFYVELRHLLLGVNEKVQDFILFCIYKVISSK